jgi:hypothetical protein
LILYGKPKPLKRPYDLSARKEGCGATSRKLQDWIVLKMQGNLARRLSIKEMTADGLTDGLWQFG